MKALHPLPVLFLCLTRLSADPVSIVVVADRVNLRTAPTLESDVVARANYGDTLTAVGFRPEWVEVRPPPAFPTWVFSEHLFEGEEVRIPVLNVRAGPGVNQPVVGQIQRGTEVEVEEVLEDWSRIAPPEAITLWISRRYIQAPPEAEDEGLVEARGTPEPTPTADPTPTPDPAVAIMPGPQPPPTATPAPTPTPVPTPTPETVVEVRTVEKVVEVPVVPTPTPTVAPPEGLDLVPLSGQGAVSVRRGRVKSYLLAGTSPSRFLLVREKDGREKTLAYLHGEEEELKDFAGREVTVRGRDFWVSGKRLPVTEVTSIQRVEDDD